MSHEEKIPSAVERHVKKINRVTGVLVVILFSKSKKMAMAMAMTMAMARGWWLVGGKYSFAELAFVSWQVITKVLGNDDYNAEAYPPITVWVNKMLACRAVQVGWEQGARLT